MNLTQREQEIISILSQGLSCKQIAEKLKISDRTVQTHLSHIYKKLGVNSRLGAVCCFIRNYH